MSGKKPILYGAEVSPPVRAVRLTLAALDLDYEYKIVDLYGGETRKPEFLKKNPQHSVPTWEEPDNGICVWDSHAIMAYLIRKYAKDDKLYPKDYYLRAIVDQRLHFESGELFMNLGKNKLALQNATKEKLPEMKKTIVELYELLELFLNKNDYIACNQLTIADFSIVSTLSAVWCMHSIDAEQFPKLTAWKGRLEALPYYNDICAEGIEEIRKKIQTYLAQLQ